MSKQAMATYGNKHIKQRIQQLQNVMKRLDKMGVVVVGFHLDDVGGMTVVEALHTNATAGLIALGKAKKTNQGIDKTGFYHVYGLFVGNVYLRFTVRP